MCTICAPGTCGGQKMWLNPLKPELQMIVGCHVGAETESGFSAVAANSLNTVLSLQPV